jgi:RNA polymerase sigma factor (sigma-70 family)
MVSLPVTGYSVVAAMRSASDEVRRSAFDTLVSAYWKPVFKYLRLKWHASPDDAADLTKAFFLRALEKDFFTSFDPARARLNTFLRTCLDRLIANARRADSRLERAGGPTLAPLDFAAAERELEQHARHAVEDFDAYFDREWVRSLFARALDRLRDGCRKEGRQRRLTIFERYDLTGAGARRPTYGEIARALGIAKTDVTNELAAARREFRRLVFHVLREQCATDEEFETERRALVGTARLK